MFCRPIKQDGKTKSTTQRGRQSRMSFVQHTFRSVLKPREHTKLDSVVVSVGTFKKNRQIGSSR